MNVIYGGKLHAPVAGLTEIGRPQGEYVWPVLFGYALRGRRSQRELLQSAQAVSLHDSLSTHVRLAAHCPHVARTHMLYLVGQ